jgi:hypothetical protein
MRIFDFQVKGDGYEVVELTPEKDVQHDAAAKAIRGLSTENVRALIAEVNYVGPTDLPCGTHCGTNDDGHTHPSPGHR